MSLMPHELNQPLNVPQPIDDPLAEARRLLAQGWRLCEPVTTRHRWSVADTPRQIYSLIFHRPDELDAVRLVVVEDSAAARHFLKQHQVRVTVL